MQSLSFRQKLLVLAIALVMVIQLVTLFPVLDVIKRDADRETGRSVNLAGVVFREFMRNRTAQLVTTADVLAADFGFKQAVTGGDRATMESALENHAARAGANIAVLLDLDGNLLASSDGSPLSLSNRAFPQFTYGPDPASAKHTVTDLGDTLYQTVTVPVKAPVAVAWVMLGFAIDSQLATHVGNLTGLETTFIRFGVGEVDPVASTLNSHLFPQAMRGLRLGDAETATVSPMNDGYLTLLRPFLEAPSDLYVALQLSMSEATASYRRIRDLLILITGGSLILAISGAFWLANKVTRPVQEMAEAVRRMQDGVYTEALQVDSTDEIGELAAGFNGMQKAIADREKHIFHIAHHDSLSGLPNRELVVSRLRETLEVAERLVVVSLALNRFNTIVATLGHRAGDELIERVAGLLRTRLVDGQILGHSNRHEFVLVLPGFDRETAVEYVQQLTDLLRSGVTASGANISLQATAGIACSPDHGKDAAELLRRSSVARNDAQLRYEPIVTYRIGEEDRALKQIRIVGDFPGALKNNELELSFQPKIDCVTREVVGAEALVRWRHPELGVLLPDTFIEAIEQAGGIAHLTRWVLTSAVACCATWRQMGLRLSLAVNISADDLVDEYLPYFLLDLIRRNGLRPADLTLEVTESAIMHNVQMSLSVVGCIRELGFRVAMDDFGTGQSALAQLKRLPLDELKIDKSFIMNMSSAKDEAIVRATVELAHLLELSVVAEGVEDAQALERLRLLGCESAQGYFISKPLPAAEFPAWVKRWSAEQTADIVSLVQVERPGKLARGSAG
jgi:diguanylate cyclase (GGDEF)-like protein